MLSGSNATPVRTGPGPEGSDGRAGGGVDDRDVVALRVRDIQPVVEGVQRRPVRVVADVRGARDGHRRGVHDAQVVGRLREHEEALVGRVGDETDGVTVDRDGPEGFGIRGVPDHDRVVVREQEHVPVARVVDHLGGGWGVDGEEVPRLDAAVRQHDGVDDAARIPRRGTGGGFGMRGGYPRCGGDYVGRERPSRNAPGGRLSEIAASGDERPHDREDDESHSERQHGEPEAPRLRVPEGGG